MDALTIGSVVHYVDSEQREHAAVVTVVFDKERGFVELRSLNDLLLYAAHYSETKEMHTWHLIEWE